MAMREYFWEYVFNHLNVSETHLQPFCVSRMS